MNSHTNERANNTTDRTRARLNKMDTRQTTRDPPYLEREEYYGEREEYEWQQARTGAQSRRVTGAEAPAAPRSMPRYLSGHGKRASGTHMRNTMASPYKQTRPRAAATRYRGTDPPDGATKGWRNHTAVRRETNQTSATLPGRRYGPSGVYGHRHAECRGGGG